LEKLCFVDANTGYAAGGIYSGSGGVVKTLDGGNKWTILLENYPYYLRAVKFINSDIGWVVGDHGTILKTINGGSTWTAQTSNTTNRLNSVFFLNESVGWIAGYYGTLLKTTNGGSTWTPQSVGSSHQLFVYFQDANIGWIISGNNTIQKTTNGGTTWTSQTISTTGNLYNLRFLDANIGWTCTTDGKIFKTSNGGSTWTAVATFSSEYFYDIFFTDKNNGWVVGGDWSLGGSIRKTIDGGVTWTLENSHTANSLMSVGFVGKTMGWTSGAQGVILHYTDYSPATQASNLTKSNSTFQSVNVSWTRGNGNQCALFVKQASTGTCTPDVNVTYLPNATYGLGDQIGSTGWYCVYNGSGTSASINGLQANTTYRFQVCEYNFSPDFTHYNSTIATNNPLTAISAIAPPSITGNPNPVTICENLATSFSVTASGTSLSYQWKQNSGAIITNEGVYSGATTATLTLTGIQASLNGLKYYCVVSNTSGNATSSEALLTVNPLPVSPGIITGDPIVCKNSNYTFIVPPINYATSYEWSFPSGFTGTSTTNTINLSTASNSVEGNITVKGKNTCGSGPIKIFLVSVKNYPGNATTITGEDKVCTGSINIGYNTASITDADYYIWSLPLGASGTSTINSLMVSYGSSPVTDQIAVRGHNMCGDGVAATLPVTVSSVPSESGAITGLSNVCKNQTDVAYSVTAINGATSYLWALPPGVTGSNSTNSVSLSFGPDAFSGDLKVAGVNSCGTGPEIVFPVIVDEVPAPTGTISGLSSVCRGQSNVLYSIAQSDRATYYVWDLPDGSSETTFTSKIVMNFGNDASSGTLYVTPFNSCGSGIGSSLLINVPVPSKPLIDSGRYTPGICLGETPVRLSIKNPETNYSYKWFRNGAPIGNSTFIEGFLEQGYYYVQAKSGECTQASDSILLVFKDAPPKPVLSVKGPTVWYLTSSIYNAAKYKWYFNGKLILGAEGYIYFANQNLGKYNVSISNDNSCFTISDTIMIPPGITGIKEADPFSGLKIYPNPTPGMFTIEMDNNIFGDLLIDILNQTGSKVLNIKFDKSTDYFMSQIDLSGESKGMYIINLAIKEFTATRKLIVE